MTGQILNFLYFLTLFHRERDRERVSVFFVNIIFSRIKVKFKFNTFSLCRSLDTVIQYNVTLLIVKATSLKIIPIHSPKEYRLHIPQLQIINYLLTRFMSPRTCNFPEHKYHLYIDVNPILFNDLSTSKMLA